jgi:hypothetical protein
MIGNFRIGFDIPLLLSDVSDSEEEDSDDETKTEGDQEEMSTTTTTTNPDAYDYVAFLTDF